MKRLFAFIFAMIFLCGCQTEPPVEIPEEKPAAEAPVVEETPAEPVEIPVETVEPEKYYTEMNLDAPYETLTSEGLVEDSVGYIYEYPVFSEIAGAEKINTYYTELMDFLADYAKEVVYPQCADRYTIANVNGTFEIDAADEGLQLAIVYTVTVQFADADEPESFSRTDVFHPDTGILLGTA